MNEEELIMLNVELIMAQKGLFPPKPCSIISSITSLCALSIVLSFIQYLSFF